MARKIQVFVLCDVCLAADTETPGAEEIEIGLGRGRSVTVALCKQHDADIVEPVRAMLAALPAPSSRAKSDGNPDEMTCPICPPGSRAYTKASLRTHLRNLHGTTITETRDANPEWAQAAGLVTAQSRGTDAAGWYERVCPIEGCGFSTMTGQGFGAHLRQHPELSEDERERVRAKVRREPEPASA